MWHLSAGKTKKGGQRDGRNPVLNILGALGIAHKTAAGKFVPPEYLTATRHERLELLAGLLDTDGHLEKEKETFDFISKSEILANNVVFLARSVGLYAKTRSCQKYSQNGTGGTYYRVYISGDTHIIPTRLPRKRAKYKKRPKDPRREAFTVELLPPNDYFGFTLSGDGRYLMDDFTITHNSGKGSSICAALHLWDKVRWLILVHRAQLARELGERFTRLTGEPHGLIAQGRGDVNHRVVFGTYQSFYSQRKNKGCLRYLASVEGVVADELHVASAESFSFVLLNAANAYWKLGTSGTPFDRGDGRNALAQGLFGPVIDVTSYQELREANFVADVTVYVIPCHQKNPRSVADAELPMDVDIPEHLRGRVLQSSDPKKVYNDYIAFSDARNTLLLRCLRHADNNQRLPAIVFVKLLAHGRMLQKRIERMGLRAELVTGADTAEIELREELIGRLGQKGPAGIDVIVGNVVLQEGIDNEHIRAVINARAGLSRIATLQQTGRGARIGRTVEKTECWVYEIQDFGQSHIERHSRARLAAYRKTGLRIVNLLETDLPEL
jgi:superfamily II DNA or RNA helicase